MTTYYAHSGSPEDHSDWQPLREHLIAVGQGAADRARAACPEDQVLTQTAAAAGLLHDLGKYQPEWQNYLEEVAHGRPAGMIPHAIYGAAWAVYQLQNQAIAWAVAGHHAGLYDCNVINDKLLIEQEKFQARLAPLVQAAQTELGEWPEEVPDLSGIDPDQPDSCRRYELWCRVLFSLLVDSDRLDTERHQTGRARPPCLLNADQLLEVLEQDRAKRAARRPADSLNILRNRVFDECRDKGGHESRGFFALTVPTGGGKTLSAMAFALAHARRHNLRRVIVVIPYLSIIEQNAREYRDIFGPGQVIEHHSATERESKPSAEAPTRTAEELATENWDGPVIVTTSVQFLESLLAASPRRCRKLHNIARSVVVFDEAQALPTHLLNPLLSVFRDLKDHYGVSMIFSTATQPAFRRSAGLTEGFRDGELRPILPTALEEELFTKLRRVRYLRHLDQTWTWEQLAERLVAGNQALCVLNTRAHARAVWEAARQQLRDKNRPDAVDGVLHLSSAMCAAHRTHILGNPRNPRPGSVRDRLRRKLPCWLCSTQVIEAGVDVDFPAAFRALGPLDSIVQVAGRVNREGLLGDTPEARRLGDVHIFRPTEPGLPQGVYEKATGLAATFLAENDDDRLATDPAVFREYFDQLFGRIATDRDVRGERSIQEDRAEFNFRRVAERSQVIRDSGEPVIVPYGPAPKLVAAIRRAGTFSWRTARRLQRFMVNVRQRDMEALRQAGQVQPLVPDREGLLVLSKASYHAQLGVIVGIQPPEEFII